MPEDPVRRRIRVRGTVQGVGFRPFVYGAARRLGLAGFVLNDTDGVLIEAEGPPQALDALLRALATEAPALAIVESITHENVPPHRQSGFEIRDSEHGAGVIAAISADVATCDECLAEIFDPERRRYRYAFTNCTQCGPRFTITTAIPYDRPNTTMSSFEMCASCKAEYEDPWNRRFHAQPIACPECGPRLRLLDPDGTPRAGDPISEAARLLNEGGIVAVKGLGGYHLACDATDEAAVTRLRLRKGREEKPLAVMAPDAAWALRCGRLDEEEVAALTSRRRPIVLARRRPESIAPSVAPGNRFLGLMLPYTPLHHLLLAEIARPMVMTSGNVSDEPIAYQDDDAFARLGSFVDLFLTHDRPIHLRCDDSVVRMDHGRAYLIRRSRGYAPAPIGVPLNFQRPVLAAGSELKHTFCLGVGDRAIVSHHIGDLENYEALSSFMQGVEHFQRIFEVRPDVVAHDLHPDYLSTRWALEQDADLVGVQHHHAHIASCLADNSRLGRVIGLALDGTGYGTDGTVWGCEIMRCDLHDFERLAHLRYIPLPGSSAAIREPWRVAAVYLHEAFGNEASSLELSFVRRTAERWGPILKMASTGLNSPRASSAGRLFDAVAALCGVRERVSYEGQAAAELEQIADPSVRRAYPSAVEGSEIDGVALVRAAAEDLIAGVSVPHVAAAFHNGFAEALVRACRLARERSEHTTVALSGGSWQNVLLLSRTREGLAGAGFEVLVHHRVPANDGGISLGQAVVAGAVTGALPQARSAAR